VSITYPLNVLFEFYTVRFNRFYSLLRKTIKTIKNEKIKKIQVDYLKPLKI